MRRTIPFPRFRALLHFLVTLSCLLLATNSVNAQSVSVNLKNVTIKEILKAIEKQTDLTFVYNNNVVDVNKRASLSVTKLEINAALDLLLKNTGYGYKIVEKQIIISPLNYLQQSNKSSSGEKIDSPDEQNGKQADKTIKGTVVDESDQPFPGVSIQNITTKKATFSGINGEYTLEAKAGDKLLFSSIGMLPKEITFSGKASIVNIVMVVDNITLQDVVVTGYQTISKERATGSFNIIKAGQIEKPSTNIAQRLIGTTAGLQSTTDANGNVSFEIRGQSSLLAGAQPLVVVDGFPTQDNFNSINPNDVESISILKDAAAASIWGAKSANGVIVVTTKKGTSTKKGQVKVDVQTFWKFSPKIDWSYANPNATSAETVDYETRGYGEQGFFGSSYWLPNQDTYQDYGAHSLAVTAMNERRLGYMSESEMQAQLKKLSGQNNAGQIKKYMLDNPFSMQNNVNISQSTDRASNMLSLMYEQQDKYLKGNSSNKYNVGYRTNVKLFKWLDFTFNGNFNMTESRNNAIEYDILSTMSPYQMIVNEDGTRNYDMWGDGSNSSFYAPNMLRYVPTTKFPYSDWTYNPITEREGRNYKTTKTSIRAQAGLTFHLIKGLTFDSKAQYERIETYNKNINDETTMFVRGIVNQASTWNTATNQVTTNLPLGGIMDQSKSIIDSYNWRNQANFDRSFNDGKHQISVIAGTEISDIVSQGTNYSRTYGYNDDKLTVGTFPNGVGGSGVYKLTDWTGYSQKFSYTNSYTYNTERYFSLYANASYTFDRKYTVSGSVRTDASNLITDDPKYRYAPFWSIGASWVMSEENFMKNISWLDRMTVRGTFGYNGNVDRSTSFLPLINVNSTQNTYIQDYTATISSYGNPALRWEKTGSLDLGVDFSMFKGKLYGKIDGYSKQGKDLIVSMTIPSVNGTTSQKLNAAQMSNKGIEIELGSSLNILNRDITWTGGLTFSYNKNEINKLYKDSYQSYDLYNGGTSAYVEGHNANTLWSYQYAGVTNVGTESKPVWRPVVKGANGTVNQFTGWAAGDARTYMANSGTLVAPYVAGLTSNFKIYDFDISLMFTGKFGHVFRGLSFNYPSMAGGSALPNKVYSEVLNSDPNKMVPIPFDGETRYYFWDRYYPYLDYLVQKAGHIRCQEISISYNIPQSILQKLRMSKATVYAQGNNLFMIQNNKYNEDPDYPMGNIKPTPSFTFGLNFTF